MFSRIGKYYNRSQIIGMAIDVNRTVHLYVIQKQANRGQLKKGKQKLKKKKTEITLLYKLFIISTCLCCSKNTGSFIQNEVS